MYLFQRHAPVELTPHAEPPLADRSGAPLSQGFLFTLISMVIGDRCSPATLEALTEVDPEAWYHGQALEAILDETERRSPEAPYQLGRAVYFMLPDQLRRLGVTSPETFFATLPQLWLQATRGDCGWFRAQALDSHTARVELQQPYNCQFEAGAIIGFLEGLGCEGVTGRHSQCIRHGAPHCTLDVAWKATRPSQ